MDRIFAQASLESAEWSWLEIEARTAAQSILSLNDQNLMGHRLSKIEPKQ
jgi:hypothetical protein